MKKNKVRNLFKIILIVMAAIIILSVIQNHFNASFDNQMSKGKFETLGFSSGEYDSLVFNSIIFKYPQDYIIDNSSLLEEKELGEVMFYHTITDEQLIIGYESLNDLNDIRTSINTFLEFHKD